MGADGHLNFDTKIDEAGFSGGIKRLGGIAAGGLKILSSAVTGVTAVMGAGMAAGMKYNSEMENYFANFETMLGSAEAATLHVNDLKEFAAKTPFEMSDLAGASKTLLAFGTNVDNIMPKLQQLGDISLGNKEKFNSLALVYGQVSSQGKLMGQDLLQMINAGFNPLLEISKHTGESMESLKDKMSKGQIGIEDIDQALQWATESGGKFAGGMEKASQTFSGQISTLKDNAMSLLGEVVQPISESMTSTLLPAAIEAVDGITQAFRDNGTDGLIEAGSKVLSDLLLGIANKAPDVIRTATTVISNVVTALVDQAPSFISAGSEVFAALLDGFIQLAPELATAGLTLLEQLATGIIENIPVLFETACELITGFGQYILENGDQILLTALGLLQQLAIGIIENIPMLVSTALQIVNSLAQFIMENIPMILQVGLSVILAIGQAIVTNLPLLLQSAIQIITQLCNGLLQNLPLIAQAVLTLIQGFLNFVVQNLPIILQSALQIITQLCNGLVAYIPQLIPVVTDIIMAFFNFVVDNLPTIINAAVEIITALMEGLIDNLDTLIPAIIEIMLAIFEGIIENLPTIIEGGVEIISALITGLIDAIPDIIAAIPEIVSAIWDTIVETDWLALGSDIISGIVSGLTAGVGAIVDAAKSVASSALNAAKDFLGIHSPSRVFRDQVGKYMAQGIGVGFKDNVPEEDIEDALNYTIGQARRSINLAMDGKSFHSVTEPEGRQEEGFDYDQFEERMDNVMGRQNKPVFLDGKRIDEELPEGTVPAW